VVINNNTRKEMPAVTFIDAIPHHVSVEEHRLLTGATPASFSDIPPVLMQKVDNIRVAFDPPLDGFSPADGSIGTLYIIERFSLFSFLVLWLDQRD
jgi:chloride channel, nucleotide-sensitive, 1A